jgi:hypothetical protein
MAKQIKPTKKDSPSILLGDQMGKTNEPAEVYARPHKMDGKTLTQADIGFEVMMPTRKAWTPLNGGVSIGHFDYVKDEGLETRGNGAAEKGRKARGPMA